MKNTQWTRRLSGLAAIAGGLLLAAGWLWALASSDLPMAGSFWVQLIGLLLIPVGTAGIYSTYGKDNAPDALAGLILANLGNPILVGALALGSARAGLSFPLDLAARLGIISFYLGTALLGRSMLRTREDVPVWAVTFWMAGAVLASLGIMFSHVTLVLRKRNITAVVARFRE